MFAILLLFLSLFSLVVWFRLHEILRIEHHLAAKFRIFSAFL
jgi:hypothetical protein